MFKFYRIFGWRRRLDNINNCLFTVVDNNGDMVISVSPSCNTCIPNEKSLYFTTENFTLLQKTLLHEKYFFLQNLSQLKFHLAFEHWQFSLF